MAALAACARSSPDRALELHVRVTAKAVADGVPKEGSSVLLIDLRRTPGSLSGYQMSMNLKGEATILDLGRGRAAYFLLKDYVHDILRGYDAAPSAGSVHDKTFEILRTATGAIEVPRDRFPKIAAFRDEKDPASVYEVDPDDFAAAFGPGAAFKSLTLELVDAPMTEAIEARLPWIKAGSVERVILVPRGVLANELSFGQSIHHQYFKME
jgi:hypothetical protein